MRQIIITLALLIGLNLSAQEKKTYQLENGIIRVDQFYPNGNLSQISFYLEGKAFGTWKKYDELGNVTMKSKMENGRPVKITHFQNGNIIVIDRRKN
jgi:antitoxin component YwqK of YwqJK toxin-antitoxin module